MPPRPGEEITSLLERARAGDASAKADLIQRIYAELRQIAGRLMRRQPAGSLSPTVLVREALLRLDAGEALAQAPDRRYLFAAAAQAMRRVLVDHARARRAAKRGGEMARVPLDDVLDSLAERRLDVLALDEALDRLAALNERQWLVVVLRFFADFSVEEVARTLEVSVSTVESDFRMARAFLHRALADGGEQ